MADAVEALAARGFRVRVVTSGRGYDDPSARYAPREHHEGVEIYRVPCASFGKRNLFFRLAGAMSFVVQAMVRGVLGARPSAILVTTVPPMGALAALIVAAVRRTPVVYWVMDLNPDQAVALGRVGENSILVTLMEALNRSILRRAAALVVLDRFMQARVSSKTTIKGRVTVLPPWPHEEFISPVDHASNPFRKAQGWEGKLVVMYSGNHGPSNPVDTLLEAAVLMREEPKVVFAFIGGGVGKADVEETIRRHDLKNVVSLPYQPREQLRYSLSAADIHVVTLGREMVGIVHPCKIYGAMAAGRPVILIGPERSHASDILALDLIGWRVEHGDAEGLVRLLKSLQMGEPEELHEMGRRAQGIIAEHFSKEKLCGAFCDEVERVARPVG